MVYQKALHQDFELRFELVQVENSYGKHFSILRMCLVIFVGMREQVDQINGLQMITIFSYSHLIGL